MPKNKKKLIEALIEYCEKNNIPYNKYSIDMKKQNKDLYKFLKAKRKAEKEASKCKMIFSHHDGCAGGVIITPPNWFTNLKRYA